VFKSDTVINTAHQILFDIASFLAMKFIASVALYVAARSGACWANDCSESEASSLLQIADLKTTFHRLRITPEGSTTVPLQTPSESSDAAVYTFTASSDCLAPQTDTFATTSELSCQFSVAMPNGTTTHASVFPPYSVAEGTKCYLLESSDWAAYLAGNALYMLHLNCGDGEVFLVEASPGVDQTHIDKATDGILAKSGKPPVLLGKNLPWGHPQQSNQAANNGLQFATLFPAVHAHQELQDMQRR